MRVDDTADGLTRRYLPNGLHRPCVGGTTTGCYGTIFESAIGLHRPRVGGTTTGSYAAKGAPASCQSLPPPARGRWGAKRSADCFSVQSWHPPTRGRWGPAQYK